MNPRSLLLVTGLLCLFVSLSAKAEGNPVIAPEIASLIDAGNSTGAQARYDELSGAKGLDMMQEITGLNNLLVTYTQAGRQADAELVGDMVADLNQKMLSDIMSGYPPQMAAQMQAMQAAQRQADAQQEANRQAEREQQERQAKQARGKSRDDLERFKGLYSPPGGNASKAIFVTVSCDGYLVTGPMWADVGPWWMRSASPTVFTYSDSHTTFSMEFETGGDGKGKRIRHDIDGVESPVTRGGELPEDWDACLERPRR